MDFIKGDDIIDRVRKYVLFAFKRFTQEEWEIHFPKWVNATALRIRGLQDIKRFKWAVMKGRELHNLVLLFDRDGYEADEHIKNFLKNVFTEENYRWQMIMVPRIKRVGQILFEKVMHENLPDWNKVSQEWDLIKEWQNDLHRLEKWIPYEEWKNRIIEDSTERYEEEEEENPFLKRSEVTETRGNLFDLGKKYALVHCIAEDAHMGAGIALQFRNKYPGMQAYIRRMKPKVGDIVVYFATRAKGDSEDRIIVNLVTKKTSWDKPTYRSLEEALNKLEEWQRKTENPEVRYLGMPRIGSGLDKLHWDKVHEMIERIFYYSVVSINIRDGK